MSSNVYAKDVMTSQVVTVNEFETLQIAENIFATHAIHHLPVVSDQQLVGIISNTDIERCKYGKSFFVNRNTSEYNEALLKSTCIGTIMSKEVSVIEPNDTIDVAYQHFKNNQFRCLPVVSQSKVVGIVTPLDLLDYFFQNK